jgi:TetR/AcrR family transcriptional regulator, repressor for neighboring sulfatase
VSRKPNAPPRIRRDPEQARQHILDAADRVFQDHLPDAVGLREIAVAAEVSHGLVTHYFGTYDALVEAAVERRVARARETAFAVLAEASVATIEEEAPLLTVLLTLGEDRALLRLLSWTVLSGRDLAAVIKPGALGRLIDAATARLAQAGANVPRARVEFATTTAIAVVVGWAIAGPWLSRATGQAEAINRPEAKRELQRLLRGYLAI